MCWQAQCERDAFLLYSDWSLPSYQSLQMKTLMWLLVRGKQSLSWAGEMLPWGAAPGKESNRVTIRPCLARTVLDSLGQSWLVGQKSQTRAERGGGAVWCTKQVSKQAPLPLCGSKACSDLRDGILVWPYVCPHCSCIAAVTPAHLPAWCTVPFHQRAGLRPRTFHQLTRTGLCNPAKPGHATLDRNQASPNQIRSQRPPVTSCNVLSPGIPPFGLAWGAVPPYGHISCLDCLPWRAARGFPALRSTVFEVPC